MKKFENDGEIFEKSGKLSAFWLSLAYILQIKL